MLKNYLKIALRNIKRHKGYSFINIVGLAIGMACCILIFLWVQDELSYDRFHKNADRIYRVTTEGFMFDLDLHSSMTPEMLAETLRNDYPEGFIITHILSRGRPLIKVNNQVFLNERVIGVDRCFFDVFSFPFIAGDPKMALSEPNNVVITQTTARKFFGNANPIGCTIILEDKDHIITGLIADVPRNSHLQFDILISVHALSWYGSKNWLDWSSHSYLVLPDNMSVEQLEAKLKDLSDRHITPRLQEQRKDSWYELELEPLLKIHLYSDLNAPFGANSRIEYVYIFSILAIFILLIACANYINLTTAKLVKRAKEVGVRKVVGSSKAQIIRQFLFETIFLSLSAMMVSLVFVEGSLPLLRSLVGRPLYIHYFNNPFVLPGFFLLSLLIGVLAGFYPAVFLSSFKPVAVLKGTVQGGKKNSFLRNTLVIFQFVISIFLIISTLVINQQLCFFSKKNLGFDRDKILVIRNVWRLEEQRGAFKEKLRQYTGIVDITGSSHLPGKGYNNWTFYLKNGKKTTLDFYTCDSNFLKTLKITLVQGRFFSQEFGQDIWGVILNEQAVREFGWSDPLGKKITRPDGDTYTVIGVIKNFHYRSLHSRIGRLALVMLDGRRSHRERYIAARIRTENIPETLSLIEKTWKSFRPHIPLEYSFLDEDYSGLYLNEQRTRNLSLSFSFLAVFISVLGLFGLAAFAAEQRTKEIGIRKVLGATNLNIVYLISKEYTWLVLLANIIAWPVAYYAMNRWLQNFAYRVNIGLWTFILAAALAFIIALATVSYQSIKAALANPVESLRYE